MFVTLREDDEDEEDESESLRQHSRKLPSGLSRAGSATKLQRDQLKRLQLIASQAILYVGAFVV